MGLWGLRREGIVRHECFEVSHAQSRGHSGEQTGDVAVLRLRLRKPGCEPLQRPRNTAAAASFPELQSARRHPVCRVKCMIPCCLILN